MGVPLLDLRAQHAAIRDEMLAAVTELVDSQKFILGEPVERLENAVAALSNTTFAIGCASGTDALLLALRALDIGAGDEVITTPFTFFATAGTIHNVGAKPVFVDIEAESMNINPEAIPAAVTERSRAVIPVDLFGQMAAIERIAALVPGLPIIEDAAQSIGARREIDGKWVTAGQVATMGTLSFFPSKNLGGYGDGGMIVTQDADLALRLRRLRVHGGLQTYLHEEVGYNSRLDALQAVVLLAKLPHLHGWSEARRANASYYNLALADVGDLRTPVVDPANDSIFNQYTIRTSRRDALREHLTSLGIGSSVYYPLPLHLQPCFAYLGYKKGSCPVAEQASLEVLSLPIYPELGEEQLAQVVEAIRDFFE